MTYRHSIRVTYPPALPIVTLQQAKDHMAVIHSSDDSTITTDIMAASDWVSDYLNSAVVKTGYRDTLDRFPGVITLRRGPVQVIDSITYLDDSGSEQTLSPAVYDVDYANGEIYLAADQSWPSTLSHRGSVSVNYSAGYYTPDSSDTADIPDAIQAACLLKVGDLYDNREGQQGTQLSQNATICALLAPYKLHAL